MIVKHIPIRKLSKSSFSGLVNYITNAQNRNERVGEVRISNCQSEHPIWAAVETESIQAQNSLSEKGYGTEQLSEIKSMIDAEKSDLFDVLAYVAYSRSPITRQDRVALHKNHIFAHYDDKHREFLDFVLSQYVKEGEQELDRAKLPNLLELKYHAVSDASEMLGGISSIRNVFIGFQQYLYDSRMI